MERGSQSNVSVELTCKIAGISQLIARGISLVCLREDGLGASLNGSEPTAVHVVERKCWLKCRGVTTLEKKQGHVKR